MRAGRQWSEWKKNLEKITHEKWGNSESSSAICCKSTHTYAHTYSPVKQNGCSWKTDGSSDLNSKKKCLYWVEFQTRQKNKNKKQPSLDEKGKKKNSLKWHHVKLGISFFSPKTSGKSHENSKLKNTRITVGLTMTLTAYADLKKGENSISMIVNSSIFYFFLRKSTGWLPWHKIKKRYPKKPTMGVRSILAE